MNTPEQRLPEPESVDLAFSPELRQAKQAQQEFNVYLENRPYQDEQGHTYSPAGEVVDAEAYFSEQRSIAQEGSTTKYEDMQAADLAMLLGQAEYYGDRTKQENISDVLLDKLAVMEAETVNHGSTAENNADSDFLWDATMAIKDNQVKIMQLSEGLVQSKNDDHSETENDLEEPDPETFIQDNEHEYEGFESVMSPLSVKRRIVRAFRDAKYSSATRLANRLSSVKDGLNRLLTNEDGPEKKRKKLAASLVGGTVLVAAAYGAYKLGAFDGVSSSGEKPETPPQPDTADSPAEDGPARSGGSAEANAGGRVSLEPGETIWGESSDYLSQHGHQPTDANIDRLADAVREKYGLSEAEARNLPVGYSFQIPPEALEEIDKK